MIFLKNKLLPLVLATVVIALSACSGVNQSVTASRPRDEAFRRVLKKELSSLNVPVETTSDELGRLLNQVIQKELYRGSTKTRGMTADIFRNGPISVRAADNYLYFTLPVTMALSYGMFESPPFPLTLNFKANASVTPDWKVRAEIKYIGLSDQLAEEVGIGPISLKPRSILEGLTQPLQKMLSELVSRKINEKFSLKTRIAQVWNAAQKPVLLDKGYNAWLKLTPRDVMLSPLYARDNRVRLTVAINSYAELVLGPEPALQPATPLPNLQPVNSIDKNFRIALNADLFFKDIHTIALPLLLNQEFDSDGKKIVIKDLDIYGNGDRLVVKVETGGSLEGVFYLTGKPCFDLRTNVFSVEDLEFDMQSRSLLLQSADWFLHSLIRSRIQEKLVMDLTQRIEQSRAMAQKAIAQVRMVDHVLLKGNIKTLKFGDLLVQEDKISIRVYAEGDSVVSIQ